MSQTMTDQVQDFLSRMATVERDLTHPLSSRATRRR